MLTEKSFENARLKGEIEKLQVQLQQANQHAARIVDDAGGFDEERV